MPMRSVHLVRRRFHRAALAAGAAALILAATACSGGDETSATTVGATVPTTSSVPTAPTSPPIPTVLPPTVPPTAPPTAPPPTLPAIPRQPLTGGVLSEGDLPLGRPALAVKIDNHEDARRHHTGIGLADIVFEEIVEGGLTRFAAVFHSQDPGTVGPIRSGRSQDVDILTSFDHPLFAWSGGNPGVTRLIADSVLQDLNWQQHTDLYRRGEGMVPHNLYSNTDQLWATAPDRVTAPPQQFEYVRPENQFRGQTPVSDVRLELGHVSVRWEFDPTTGLFRRFQEGSPHVDAANGQITARNVVIMVAEYRPSQIDARSPEAQTIGNAPVWVLSDGRVMTGRWNRESADQPIQLLDDAGAVIELQPGNTWIELVEARPGVDEGHPDAAVILE